MQTNVEDSTSDDVSLASDINQRRSKSPVNRMGSSKKDNTSHMEDSTSDDVSLASDISSKSPVNKIRISRKDNISPSSSAKEQCSAEKLAKVTEIKEKWAREKEAKLTAMNERRIELQKYIAESSQKESEIRKMRVAIHEEDRRRKLQVEKDILESSAADRAHQAAELERISKARRKHSLMLNKEMMRQFREKKVELEIAMKEEEAGLHACRRADFIALRDGKTAAEDRRRESLMGRGLVAQVHKELDEISHKVKLQERNDMMDFRKLLSANKIQNDKDNEEIRREELVLKGKNALVCKNVNEELNKIRHNEDVDIVEFRRELALHKAEKEKIDNDERRQYLFERGKAAEDGKKVDQLLEKIRIDEERDALQYRREMALQRAEEVKELSNEKRELAFLHNELTREDSVLYQQLQKDRQDENRDIFNFRRDLALTKAQSDKDLRIEEQQILLSNAEIALNDKKIDQIMEKARRDEDKDMIEFRRELAKHDEEKLRAEKNEENLRLQAISQREHIFNDKQKKERQEENTNIGNYRYDTSLAKAAKDKADTQDAKQELIIKGEMAQGEDRKSVV